MTTVMFVGDSITVGLVGSTAGNGFRGPFGKLRPKITMVGPMIDKTGLKHGGIGGSTTWTFLKLIGTWYATFVVLPGDSEKSDYPDGLPKQTWVEIYKPDIIHIMLGTNDIISWKESAATLQNRLYHLAILAKKEQPKAAVYVSSISSAGTSEFAGRCDALNQAIARGAGSDYRFSDSAKYMNKAFRAEGYKAVTSDGTHPNDRGYDLLAQGVAEGIASAESAPVGMSPATKIFAAAGIAFAAKKALDWLR